MATAQLPQTPTTPRKRTDLVYGMTGQNPAFSPPTYTLPQNYNFGDLANYETTARNAFGKSSSEDILKTRDELSKSLGSYGSEFFKQQNPALLEDLNTRGLLTSQSEVANKEAQALKEIELKNSDYLSQFDTAALSARLQGGQDALDAGLDLRRGGLEQSHADANSQSELDAANRLADKAGRNSLYGSLIGAGGSILGASLPTLLAKKAPQVIGEKVAGKVAPTLLTDAGVADVPGTVATPGAAGTGIGLGGAVGLGAAGVASSMMARAVQNKVTDATGNKTTGTAAGIFANPIGGQINLAKDAISKTFGAGKTGANIGNQQASMNDLYSQANSLKEMLANGQIDQQSYEQAVDQINQQAIVLLNQTASIDNKASDNIRPQFNQFISSGLINKVGNDAYASNYGDKLTLDKILAARRAAASGVKA